MTDDRLPTADERARIGDYTAGDLTSADGEAMEGLLEVNAQFRREAEFWKGLRSTVKESTDDAVPDARLLTGIDHRLTWERASKRPIWVRFTPIAAAALIAFSIAPLVRQKGGARAAPVAVAQAGIGVLAWFEDGSEVVLPPQTQALWSRYLPLATVTTVSMARPTEQILSHEVKPWLGVWTRPVQLLDADSDDKGHLLVRVANGSPAADAGLEPGDVITAVGDCPVFTPQCIASLLAKAKPGDRFIVHYWQGRTGKKSTVSVVLGHVVE
jgi:membrane-associated protease RseP (regulator of RpoE activity)